MAEQVFKKVTEYSDEKNNYIGEGEITVTITLSEYRELVSIKAVNDKLVNDANKDKYSRESENQRLKKENDELKSELYELQKKSGVLEDV